MRTACAALQNYYIKLLNREWKLFDLVHSPDHQKLPAVLTKASRECPIRIYLIGSLHSLALVATSASEWDLNRTSK